MLKKISILALILGLVVGVVGIPGVGINESYASLEGDVRIDPPNDDDVEPKRWHCRATDCFKSDGTKVKAQYCFDNGTMPNCSYTVNEDCEGECSAST